MTDIIKEGYMPFQDSNTYYRITGEPSDLPPLILIHGGPGSTHDYFELLDPLADSGRQIIMYDQTGCGKSWWDGSTDRFTKETWLDELDALRQHLGITKCHLLGQSWGGMLTLLYMLDRKPQDICSVILSSTLASASLWSRELHRLLKGLTKEEQVAVRYAEITGNYDDPGYVAANDRFMKLHCSDFKENAPECLRREKRIGKEAYLTAWGPNEYTPTGNLKDYELTDRLGELEVPALIISGTEDLCTPIVAKSMFDAIPGSRWELFAGAKHMCFAEQPRKYMRLLEAWMAEHDGNEVQE